MFRRLPYAASAPFNSYLRQHEPLCQPGTRVEVLERIHDWIRQPDSPCLYWLNGLAGTGKSTIARTIAQYYHQETEGQSTVASYFFSRDDDDAASAKNFVTTIVLQLADGGSKPLKQRIRGVLTDNQHIEQKALAVQWQKLVLHPATPESGEENDATSRIVLVVDALDECTDEEAAGTLLRLFTDIPQDVGTAIRILLTSRPEVKIRHQFTITRPFGHQTLILHEVPQNIVTLDIYKFLEAELSKVAAEQGYGPNWPDAHTLKEMTTFAAGLFIYAAIACRFVRQGKRFATRRLEQLRNRSRATVLDAEKQLDEMYLYVLENAISPDYSEDEKADALSQLHRLLQALVTSKSALNIQALSALVDLPPEDVASILADLAAIITVDESHPESSTYQNIRLLHPSLRDFLTTPQRCTDPRLYVDMAQSHIAFVHACLKVLSTEFDLNGNGLGRLYKSLSNKAPGVLQADEIDSILRIPKGLRFACENWVEHLMEVNVTDKIEEQVTALLLDHVLLWLEVTNRILPWESVVIMVDKLRDVANVSISPLWPSPITYARQFQINTLSATVESLTGILRSRAFREFCENEGPLPHALDLYLAGPIFLPAEEPIALRHWENFVVSWISHLSPSPTQHRAVVWNRIEIGLVDWNGFDEPHPDARTACGFSTDATVLACADGARFSTFDLTIDHTDQTASPLATMTSDFTPPHWSTVSEGLDVHELRVAPNNKHFAAHARYRARGIRQATVFWKNGPSQVTIRAGGEEYRKIGHIVAIKFVEDERLACLSKRGCLGYWDIPRFAFTSADLPVEACSLPITEAAFSADGNSFCVVLSNGRIETYRREPLSRTRRLRTGWRAPTLEFSLVSPSLLGPLLSIWNVCKADTAPSPVRTLDIWDQERKELIHRWPCMLFGALQLFRLHGRLFASVHHWEEHLIMFDILLPESSGCHIFPHTEAYAHSADGTKLAMQIIEGGYSYMNISELLLEGLDALGGMPADEAFESAFARISVGDQRYDLHDPTQTEGSYFRIRDRRLELVRGPRAMHFLTIPRGAGKVHVYLYPWRLYDPSVQEDERDAGNIIHDPSSSDWESTSSTSLASSC